MTGRLGAARVAELSLRARLLLVGVVGVAGALLLGGLLLYAVLTSALTRTVQASALSSAQEVALLVETRRLPDPVPVSGASVLQVLDASGRVVAGSASADRLTALVTEPERLAALAGDPVLVPGHRAGLSGTLQVAAVQANAGGAPLTVVAAAPRADVEASARTLRTLLFVLFPVLLLVLALIAWRIVGAALRPVEALRVGAARLDAASSDTDRLPVPRSRDEIAALARTLNEMLDRVAAARRAQRTFVSDAAHELRSPLASMRTQLEVASRLGEGGELPAELLPDVDRLTVLVEDLLLLARLDEREPHRRPGRADLEAALADVARRCAGDRVPVDVRLDAPGPLVVAVAPDDLARVFTNLVDNAVRHARSGVQVTVRVEDDTAVRVDVVDDGRGVPETDRERVFARFTRLDEARDRDRGGSGLGLAIVRELLRRNDGTVRLEDAGPGVRAVVSLPRAEALPHAR